MTQTGALNHRRYLKLFNIDGRTIAKISDAIEGFDEMSKLIARHINAKGDETAESIRITKAKRAAIVMMIFGFIFLGVSCMVAWFSYHEWSRLDF